ncbi:MAG: aspartate--tRNA ligase [Clostridiales bacterium]|nr:aspartate--tRNA ligase [Clostridiales bacterium]
MAELLNGQHRTVMCGEVTTKHECKKITLMGWVHRRRDLGGLIFLQLRDRSGIVQVVFDTDVCDQSLLEKASTIKLEYVVSVTGKVRRRVGNNVNPNMKTGEIELVAEQLKILSEADTTPFSIGEENASEALRLKYRYLDLRREKLQQNLIIRSKIYQITRNYLSKNGFIEIETPMLGKSTPEGARDYLVPSRVHPGTFYALPQSPQLYKQLLMIGGMDRYFQIVKCFRDEDLRANRQPEFTQIDLEMSFVDQEEDVMQLMEGLLGKMFKEVRGVTLPKRFPRMPWQECMDRFGSDKPDLRFGMEIQRLDETVKDSSFVVFSNALNNGGTVRAIVLRNGCDNLSRKDLDKLVEFVKTYKAKGLAWYGLGAEGIKCSFAKAVSEEELNGISTALSMQKGDIALMVADDNWQTAVVSLGALRCHLAGKFGLVKEGEFACLWVVDFPLLEYSEEEGRYVAMHHPFTSPKNEDLEYMKTDPARVRAKAYDVVINGDEMGGGSMRIYNREVQKLMFETIGLTDEQIADRFGFFVDAFKYGTPPHGGLAFGLDRLVMVLTDTNNIKDVIAFPKMQNASCMMSDAPSTVDDKQLKELYIKCEDVDHHD